MYNNNTNDDKWPFANNVKDPIKELDNSIKAKQKELDRLETNYARKLHETTLTITNLEKTYEKKKEELELEYKSTIEEYNKKVIRLNGNVENTLTHGRIILNVGGRLYETTVETLGPVQFFACLFSRWTTHQEHGVLNNYSGVKHANNLPLIENKYHLFIDRDPDVFYYILNYLRSGVIPQKGLISDYMYETLINELVFYGLDDLRDHLLETKQISSRIRKTMIY